LIHPPCAELLIQLVPTLSNTVLEERQYISVTTLLHLS